MRVIASGAKQSFAGEASFEGIASSLRASQ
jgi:hypothetical protein